MHNTLGLHNAAGHPVTLGTRRELWGEPREELDVFTAPASVYDVQMESDEVTALCPATGQPDYYTVTINYHPHKLCLESKSLKAYFGRFREEGVFVEEFAHCILSDLTYALDPEYMTVTVTQKARGGITISACASGTREVGPDTEEKEGEG